MVVVPSMTMDMNGARYEKMITANAKSFHERWLIHRPTDGFLAEFTDALVLVCSLMLFSESVKRRATIEKL